MLKQKDILFILNPIAGIRQKIDIESIIKNKFQSYDGEIVLHATKERGHGIQLAKDGLRDGYKKIVAIGGDGTINEVAQGLIGSDTALGIIPMGSGNGLARHLKIPLSIAGAIDTVQGGTLQRIDTGLINKHVFLCTAGIGFEAHITHLFDAAPGRGLKTYFKIVVKEIRKYGAKSITVSGNGKVHSFSAFTMCFANAAQYGNDLFISPQSKIDDGLLDLCVLKPFGIFKYPHIIHRFVTKGIQRSSKYETMTFSDLEIFNDNDLIAHIDGDPITLKGKVNVRVVPNSLSVITP